MSENEGMVNKELVKIGSFNEINGMVIDQDKEFFDLLNIHIKNLSSLEPIHIDFFQELNSFLHAGLLKPFESQAMKMKYVNMILSKRVIKIIGLCFWYIVSTRFPETVDILVQNQVQSYYKNKLSRNYVKLFQFLPQPKDELISYVIFTISYLIHFSFYKYFPPQREFFNFRFILNCYHTVLFEFNGIFVSDFYIKMMIEKFFTHKFLDYEKKNIKEIILKQMELKKLNNRKFLGFELGFPEISSIKDGQDFKDKITSFLKRDKKSTQSLNHKQQFDQQLTSIIFKYNKLKKGGAFFKNIIQQINFHKFDFIQYSMMIFFRNNQNSDRKKMGSIQNSEINQSQSSSQMSKSKQGQDRQIPGVNVRINCNQVSPTLGRLLEYEDLNLPYKKKKMIKHVFEKIDQGTNDLLNQMKMMFSEKLEPKRNESKTAHKGKTLIDQYDLRAPPKEYYQKYNKLDSVFKDMLDINYVLTEQSDQFSKLPSSIEILAQYQNRLAGQMNSQIDQKALEEKIDDQKKNLQDIEKLKHESGNQDIFDMPYNGTRAEARNMIAYVRQKCRKQLQEIENNTDSKADLKLKDKSEGNHFKASSSLILPSINTQKTILLGSNMNEQYMNDNMNRRNNNNSLINLNAATPINMHGQKQDSIIQKICDIDLLTPNMDPIFEDSSHDNHRKIISKVMQKEEVVKPSHHGNLPDYILNRALDPGILYTDKRKDYRDKYKQIFEKISVDQNINDLCLNILQKPKKKH